MRICNCGIDLMKIRLTNPIALTTLLFWPLGLVAADAPPGDPPSTWTAVCSACHGPDGRGKTKTGRLAGVKDFSDPTYQQTFSDEQAMISIKDGTVSETGRQMMLPFGEVLSNEEITTLIAYIRTLEK